MNRQPANTRNGQHLIAMVLILFLAAALATDAADKSAAAPASINVAQAKELFDQGAVFVDVRSAADWEAGRIIHAIHLELAKMLAQVSLGVIAGKKEHIVIYANGPADPSSTAAVAQVQAWGFTHVYDFRPGYTAWQAAGYAIE